jgi:hypothetical protein
MPFMDFYNKKYCLFLFRNNIFGEKRNDILLCNVLIFLILVNIKKSLCRPNQCLHITSTVCKHSVYYGNEHVCFILEFCTFGTPDLCPFIIR